MKFTDLDEAYRLRHLVLYLEEMWRWADGILEGADEDMDVRLTPSIGSQEFGPLIVPGDDFKDVVKTVYRMTIPRLNRLGVDAVGLPELMPHDEPVGKPKRLKKPKPEETDFGNLSPEQKKQWSDEIWQQGRDQNFWTMLDRDDDLVIIERPDVLKIRWLRAYSPKSWTSDRSKALVLTRIQAMEICPTLGGVVLHVVKPGAQPEPEAKA